MNGTERTAFVRPSASTSRSALLEKSLVSASVAPHTERTEPDARSPGVHDTGSTASKFVKDSASMRRKAFVGTSSPTASRSAGDWGVRTTAGPDTRSGSFVAPFFPPA